MKSIDRSRRPSRRFQGLAAIFLSATSAAALPAEAAENRVVTRAGYTVDFQDPDDAASEELAGQMIEHFFKLYPRLVADFNRDAPRSVAFIIRNDDAGVAFADQGAVTYHIGWFQKNPQDIDVVTHELMHIVQDYRGKGPGWLTEGIADYVRNAYGLANAEAGWRFQAPRSDSNYTDGYRVTGAFLAWLEAKKKRGIVKALDRRARAGTYDDANWPALAGASIEMLWQEYKSDAIWSIRVENARRPLRRSIRTR